MGSVAEQTNITGENVTRFPGDTKTADKFLQVVLDILEDAKAEDIISVNLEGKSSLGDYMVIASGRSTRHVASISEKIMMGLKEKGYGSSHVEGLNSADWVLIDASDIIIHIFRPEVRDFYNLEKIWVHDEDFGDESS